LVRKASVSNTGGTTSQVVTVTRSSRLIFSERQARYRPRHSAARLNTMIAITVAAVIGGRQTSPKKRHDR
jgi:hypothetical protein